jgi:exopolysaccharide production protein ExoQ
MRAPHLGTAKHRTGMLVEILFAVFLLVVLVGFEPFKGRNFLQIGVPRSAEANFFKQVIFSLLMISFIALGLNKKGLRNIFLIPLPFTLLMCWCLLSSEWSLDFNQSFRQALVLIVAAVTVFIAVDNLGVSSSLRVLRLILALVVLVDFSSVFFIKNAVHLYNDDGSDALIGNWRGLHYHKNFAGAVSAMAALLFFHFALAEKRFSDWILFFIAVIFAIGTQSKTSLVLLGLETPLLFYFRYAFKTPYKQHVFRWIFLTAFVIFCILVIYYFIGIFGGNRNDRVFTGRGIIWYFALEQSKIHPFIGWGYRAFWFVDKSPALDAGLGWVFHSHNGYLEILITTGAVGLIMAIWAMVLLPLKLALRFYAQHGDLLFAWVTFGIFYNLFEASMFQGASEQWIIQLIAISCLCSSARISHEEIV